ncbi:MAG: hypothetical protein A2275_02660 [Bacteroidetes bacterium RIFOXYA12_FULL_35_11]|nr:MAG: hypothetical protein A2X01_07070 [Bacteroidetes bacterium GWF2_35_48]OFY82103.1 MAG: hypothetical protein A2275_02660 [Bacteroidetes bacterium RIFOXYA12_FULL_35_11]OFY93301.1 MAG: hypothetical protein A2491_15465 [Bacteroidetes bacterium RIFOXYC12_FULL_35_7]HBX53147.1 DUF1016 domain-containing protein [Bacteroidales bacterium]
MKAGIAKKTYKDWIEQLKRTIRSRQMKAITAVNSELIDLYWYLGHEIVSKQEEYGWGAAIVENMAKDLQKEFPKSTGFSRANLFFMRQFYQFWIQLIQEQKNSKPLTCKTSAKSTKVSQAVRLLQNEETKQMEKVSQLVRQIPWGHNRIICGHCSSFDEAVFYINKTIENNWSRNILEIQIEKKLHKRQGKAVTNFKNCLPEPLSDLAQQMMKDSYNLDFINVKEKISEREFELKLITHIRDFLTELGQGFAYVGNQIPIKIGKKTYSIDLLFYHLQLRCYIIIELKAGNFKPEYAGKINFYLSAADDLLKHEHDNLTIGILLCRKKDKVEVEYALRGTKQPIGVAEYSLTKKLPENIQKYLPSAVALEKELSMNNKTKQI